MAISLDEQTRLELEAEAELELEQELAKPKAQPDFSVGGYGIDVDPRKLIGGAGNVLNGMTFGMADEMVGGTSGAMQYAADKVRQLTGNDEGVNPNMGFNDYLQTGASQFQDMRNSVGSGSKLATEIGGSILNPLSLSKYIKGAGALSRIGASGVNAGLQGAAYGFGDTNGDLSDRAQGAWDVGSLSSMFGVGAGTAGKVLESLKPLGDRFQRAGLRFRQSDYRAAKADVPKGAKNPIQESVDDLRDSGAFKITTNPTLNPDELLKTSNKQIGELGNELTPILAQADNLGGNNLLPNFTKTDSLIKTKKGSAYKSAVDIYNKEVTDLMDTLDNGGTLNDWQAAKRSVQGDVQYGTENAKIGNEIRKSIASDIKTFIENQADALLPADAGKVKALNKKMSLRYRANETFDRGQVADLASNPVNNMKALTRTSGGFGVPMLLAAGSGGAEYGRTGDPWKALGVAASGAALGSRRGMYTIGSALRQTSKLSPEALSAVSSKALNPLISDSDTIQTPTSLQREKKLIPVEKVTGASTFPDPERIMPKNPSLRASSYTQQQIQTESGGNPNAISPKGYVGMMQIGPAAMRDVMRASKIDDSRYSDNDLKAMALNEELNIKYGEAYMQLLLNKYNDPVKAAAAYNAGMGNVDKYGGVPPFPETQNYVKQVVGKYAS